MATRSGVRIEIDAARLPAIDGALDAARAGVSTAGTRNNREYAAVEVGDVAPELVELALRPADRRRAARLAARATRARRWRRSSRARGSSSRGSAASTKARGSSSVSDAQLRTTFDSVADRYDAARPSYPGRAVRRPRRACADRARRPTARGRLRNGEGDAAAARARLLGRRARARRAARGAGASEPRGAARGRSGRRVRGVGERGRASTLVYAATAWHWIEPAVRYRKAHATAAARRPPRVLGCRSRVPGRLRSVLQRDPGGLRGDRRVASRRVAAASAGEQRRTTRPRSRRAASSTAFRCGATFGSSRYTAEEYIALLDTFSGHIAMGAAKREHLYGEIRTRIERPPGCSDPASLGGDLARRAPRRRHLICAESRLQCGRWTPAFSRSHACAPSRSPPLRSGASQSLNVVMLILIVATGATVRLTGSGLGCEHWPGCQAHHFEPKSYHSYIEFGNRVVRCDHDPRDAPHLGRAPGSSRSCASFAGSHS